MLEINLEFDTSFVLYSIIVFAVLSVCIYETFVKPSDQKIPQIVPQIIPPTSPPTSLYVASNAPYIY
jgi:hypothetical protein